MKVFKHIITIFLVGLINATPSLGRSEFVGHDVKPSKYSISTLLGFSILPIKRHVGAEIFLPYSSALEYGLALNYSETYLFTHGQSELSTKFFGRVYPFVKMNSINLKGALGYRKIHVDSKIVDNDPEAISSSLSLGNLWKYDNGFLLGINWIGIDKNLHVLTNKCQLKYNSEKCESSFDTSVKISDVLTLVVGYYF